MFSQEEAAKKENLGIFVPGIAKTFRNNQAEDQFVSYEIKNQHTTKTCHVFLLKISFKLTLALNLQF